MFIRRHTPDRVLHIQGCIDMRRINKTSFVLRDNNGETIVEVTVAFTLLAIMLVIFSQGIAYATKAEVNASKSRDRADAAMIKLQHWLATPSDGTTPQALDISVDGKYEAYVRIYQVEVDGELINYAVYGADVTGT